MHFNQDNDIHVYRFRAYETGRISVVCPLAHPGARTADANPESPVEILETSFILTPKQLIKDWEPKNLDQLAAKHCTSLQLLQPELVLLGTGATQQFPKASLTAELACWGIGVEIMDSGAACRTFNILSNEGRNVAAAILF